MRILERIRDLVRLYRKAYGAYTPQIILIIVLAFVSSLAEGIGISAVVPMFSFVGGAAGAASDTISQLIAGFFSLLHIPYSFRMLLFFIAGLFVFRTFLLFGIQYVTAKIVYTYERNLRATLFDATLNARWPYLSTQQVGNLEQLLTTNTTYASQFFGNISTTAIIVTKALIYIAVAVNISHWIAGFSLLAGVVIFFVLKPFFYRSRMIGVSAERTNRELAHFVAEHMIGMKAIKAMALENPVIARGRDMFERMKGLNIRSIMLRGYIELIVRVSAVLFIGAVFAVMYRSPGFSIAAFAVIVYAINQIFSLMQAGQVQLHGVSTMIPYIAEMLNFTAKTIENQEHRGGKEEFAVAKEIEFRDVSFSYPGRGEVLSHAQFSIRKGELLGIVGPSGSGKTTLADILLRLVEPTSGAVFADGRDVRDISVADWRTHVGYVSQDAVLLNDTIEQNIRFYNAALSHEDIVHAAQQANIHEFIETLPEKYTTKIGDRGILLSGGQRQRVALARVLARKPRLLVLDEATSSLDAESEQAIQKAIEDLRGSITVVVIAHRLTTIASADRLISLRGGVVSEVAHEDVLKDSI